MFGTFTLMYWHAWRLRELLALDAIERLRTCHNLANYLAMAAIGLVSALLALVLPEGLFGWAGYLYAMPFITFVITGMIFWPKERRLIRRLGRSAAD